jgi:hypothetical protein
MIQWHTSTQSDQNNRAAGANFLLSLFAFPICNIGPRTATDHRRTR